MLIAQISDPHFLPRGTLGVGEVDLAGQLERCVAHINALRPCPEAVLLTGDLTSDGDERAYAELVSILRRLEAPLYPIPGNHDDRELMRRAFRGLGCLPVDGPLCYVVEHLPVRIVALDSLVQGEVFGRLGADQLAWLDACLAGAPERPTVVMVHHPPFPTGIGHLDGSMLQDGQALADVVRRHHQIERVLCGHAHRFAEVIWAGTMAQIAPSMAYQFQLAIGDAPPVWICEPPAILLHYWTATAGLVTHLDFVDDHRKGRL